MAVPMRRPVVSLVLVSSLLVGACATAPGPSQSATAASGSPTAAPPSPSSGTRPSGTILPSEPPASAGPRTTIYVHYYRWWTTAHWRDKLGPAYPLTSNPMPIPGTVDPTGCSPQVHYPGATIVDLPADGAY